MCTFHLYINIDVILQLQHYGLHSPTTTCMTVVLRCLGFIQHSHLPLSELLRFVLFANFSIVGMNVILMWNSVGFYQVIAHYVLNATLKFVVV